MYLVVKRVDKPAFRGHQYRASARAIEQGPEAERQELVEAFRTHLRFFGRERPRRGPAVQLPPACHKGVLCADDGTEVETLKV